VFQGKKLRFFLIVRVFGIVVNCDLKKIIL
jgi:hypothetical protein